MAFPGRKIIRSSRGSAGRARRASVRQKSKAIETKSSAATSPRHKSVGHFFFSHEL